MNRSDVYRTINVVRNVKRYTEGEGRDKGRHPDERYASFDYCFNYFQSFREQDRIGELCCPDRIHESCLQLGFYLASWGMLRASSFLLNKSARFYVPLLETVVRLDRRLWEIDVNSYTDENTRLLLEARVAIRAALGGETSVSDTLVSKIMLGIFGNVPAFDRFVRKGLRVNGFTRTSIAAVAEFYDYHRDVVDSCAASIRTLDFRTGNETGRHYTRAKIVDMAAVIEGRAPR